MGTMTITLDEKLAEFVAEQLRSGGYASANDVVAAALRRMQAADRPPEVQEKLAKLEALRAWLREQPALPVLPDEALTRESIYADD